MNKPSSCVPAHKQTDPSKAPGQQVNHVTPLGFVIQPREKTLEEYIQRKTRQEAFNEVKAEKKLSFDEWWAKPWYVGNAKCDYGTAMLIWKAAQENV